MAIVAPIRLRQLAEAFVVEDGDGTVVAYVYFEDDQTGRNQTNRLSKTDAEEAAKTMAAAIRGNSQGTPAERINHRLIQPCLTERLRLCKAHEKS